MTPHVSAIIEQTIRLQQQTNHFQELCLVLIFVSNILIFVAVWNVRKAMRINSEWSKANREWSDELSAAAIAMEARSGETEGLDPKDDSAGPQDIAQGIVP